MLLELPDEKIRGRIYNAGYQNRSVSDIAQIVKQVMAQEFPDRPEIEIAALPSDDPRSYRISSEKIKKELKFMPRRTIEDAVSDLIAAFRAGKFHDPMNDMRYYNIKTMQAINLK
jgi:nucleoside-diphosphate-sugar epimerase